MRSISFRQGYAAYIRGEARTECPHTKSPQEWHEWNRGWTAARMERK